MPASQYCDESDLNDLGIPAAALSSFTSQQKLDAITAFSSEMDGYLSPRYTVPLADWPRSLRMHCARGSVYVLMSQRGMNPNSLGNELIVKGHEDALQFLNRVARGIITLPSNETSSVAIASPAFESSCSRGWENV
jgi:phage gp36-like protein